MPLRERAIKFSLLLFVYLFIVWGLYRSLVLLPPEIEEIFIKPILWLAPTLYLIKKEKESLQSVGVTFKNLFPAIYFALCLGAIFAIEGLVINYLKYQGELSFHLNEAATIWQTFGLSFITAIPEELVFRGYIFNRLWKGLNNPVWANIISSLLWAILHIPIALVVWKMDISSFSIYIFLTFLYGVGASFIFARTKNISGPILLHVLWEFPIILFR